MGAQQIGEARCTLLVRLAHLEQLEADPHPLTSRDALRLPSVVDPANQISCRLRSHRQHRRPHPQHTDHPTKCDRDTVTSRDLQSPLL